MSVLRVIAKVALGILALVVIAAGAMLFKGYRELHRRFETRDAVLSIPTDSASIHEGERLARIRGCVGCHGSDLSGKDWFDEPIVARITSANLTEVARSYTDAQLERAIRHGISADGRNLIVMPSDMYYHLSDSDLAKLIAFLRQVPAASDTLRPTRVGPLGYFGLATGKFETTPSLIDHDAPRLDASPDAEPVTRGRYLASTTCTECHGTQFEGGDDIPALSIVAGYSEEAFRTLLRTGVPLDGRELGLMKSVALGRTANFTDQEIAAVFAFLRTLAARRS